MFFKYLVISFVVNNILRIQRFQNNFKYQIFDACLLVGSTFHLLNSLFGVFFVYFIITFNASNKLMYCYCILLFFIFRTYRHTACMGSLWPRRSFLRKNFGISVFVTPGCDRTLQPGDRDDTFQTKQPCFRNIAAKIEQYLSCMNCCINFYFRNMRISFTKVHKAITVPNDTNFRNLCCTILVLFLEFHPGRPSQIGYQAHTKKPLNKCFVFVRSRAVLQPSHSSLR